jgi:hypothetical protein
MPGNAQFMSVLPLNADSTAYSQAFGVRWDAAVTGYSLVAAPLGQ